MGTLATALWVTWKQRNAMVWMGKNLPALVAMQLGLDFVDGWSKASRNHPDGNHARPHAAAKWTKLAMGVLKCNVDGAVFSDSTHMGVGCVIRKDRGEIIQAMSNLIASCLEPAEAEALALREALSWIHRLKLSKVIIEMDCKGVVDAFHFLRLDVSEFGCLLKD